jgi:hypothetical protein
LQVFPLSFVPLRHVIFTQALRAAFGLVPVRQATVSVTVVVGPGTVIVGPGTVMVWVTVLTGAGHVRPAVSGHGSWVSSP